MNFSQRVAHSTKKDPNQYFSIIKTDPFRARLNTWLAHSKTRFTAFCLANRRSSKSLNILEFQRKPVKKRTSGIDRKSSKMELMEGCVNLNLSNCKHHRTLFLKIPFVFCEIPYLQKVIVYNITLSSTCSRLCKNTYIFSLKLVKFDISSHIFMG